MFCFTDCARQKSFPRISSAKVVDDEPIDAPRMQALDTVGNAPLVPNQPYDMNPDVTVAYVAGEGHPNFPEVIFLDPRHRQRRVASRILNERLGKLTKPFKECITGQNSQNSQSSQNTQNTHCQNHNVRAN